MNNNDNQGRRKFVRVLSIFLFFSLGAIVAIRFIWGIPPHQINAETITIILIMLILIFSESFNSFSIGKIFTMSKEVEKKDNELKEEKNTNELLRQNIINMASSFAQINASISAKSGIFIGDDFIKSMTVTNADKEIKKEAEEAEELTPVKVEVSTNTQKDIEKEKVYRDYKTREKIEKFAIEKYVSENNMTTDWLRNDVQISKTFSGIDPIINRNAFFDGYLKTSDYEIFIETKQERSISPMIIDRLYFQISQVNYYKQIKKTNAFVMLLILKLPEGYYPSYRYNYTVPNLHEIFQPAKDNMLFRIIEIKISEEEIKSILEKVE